MEVDLDNLATAYLRNHRSANKHDDFWAWEQVHQLVETDFDAGWNVTLLIIEKAESDDEVGYVAAGAVEGLIDIHGHKALDRIEEECGNNLRMRLALSTVGVLFYYDEFERWYGLLYKYGFRQHRVADRAVIGTVMTLMRSYLNESINLYDYGYQVTEALKEPLDDKAAQRILQKACEDVELLDAKKPPNYREPCRTRSEVRQGVVHAVAELESLGYEASSNSE